MQVSEFSPAQLRNTTKDLAFRYIMPQTISKMQKFWLPRLVSQSMNSNTTIPYTAPTGTTFYLFSRVMYVKSNRAVGGSNRQEPQILYKPRLPCIVDASMVLMYSSVLNPNPKSILIPILILCCLWLS